MAALVVGVGVNTENMPKQVILYESNKQVQVSSRSMRVVDVKCHDL
jgi:biotin-(acetyl-CoA carboxylase) ligase